MVTSKIADSKMLGIFENSFYLNNYEYSIRMKQDDDEKNEAKNVKENDEDKDERMKKKEKIIYSHGISCENDSILQSDDMKF